MFFRSKVFYIVPSYMERTRGNQAIRQSASQPVSYYLLTWGFTSFCVNSKETLIISQFHEQEPHQRAIIKYVPIFNNYYIMVKFKRTPILL